MLADVAIISTARTRQLMMENLDITNVKSVQNELTKANEEFSAQIATETNPLIQRWLHNEIAERRQFIEALPEMQLTLPNRTFVDKTEIQGSKRRVELVTFGSGHTKSDAIMSLPDDGVAFVGDLVLVDTHPMLATGSPDEWLTILEKLKSLGVEKIIPGHGQVGDERHIADMIQYITDLQQLVRGAVADGISLARLLDSTIPVPYHYWRFAHVFKWNLEFLFTQLTCENLTKT